MRKLWICFFAVCCLSFLLIVPQTAFSATYSQAWKPSDNSSHAITFTFTPIGGFSLHMFDWNTPETSIEIVNNESYFDDEDVYFRYDPGDEQWYAEFIAGDKALPLGDSDEFGLYFQNDGPGTTNLSYSIFQDSEDHYILTDDQGTNPTNMMVHLLDAHPVPIPSAAWIFGAGIVGLVGIRRKVTA